jgi:hypothetical protein
LAVGVLLVVSTALAGNRAARETFAEAWGVFTSAAGD